MFKTITLLQVKATVVVYNYKVDYFYYIFIFFKFSRQGFSM